MKNVLKYAGLIIASLIPAVFAFIIIGGVFEGENTSLSFESIGLVLLSVLTIASIIIAWLKMKIGVWLVLGVGILFSIFGIITAGQNRWMPVVSTGGPMILGALLMLWSLKLHKNGDGA
ncbi:hypothetical protein KQH62_00570 [bacterium]|nr:hypothetical protein [bacterium]